METPGQEVPTHPSPPQDVDAEIAGAAKRQDHEAAARLLVDEHASALGRVCMALLGSQREAELALSETLKEALETLASRPTRASIRGWLSSIARRRCARRSEARVAEASQPAMAPTSAPRARSLLNGVRPTEREALVLHFVAGLGFRELSEACGIDEAAARQRVARGLSRVRASMGEDQ